jgi:hypothetical protein
MSFLANPISFADVHVLLERLARRAETSPARKNQRKSWLSTSTATACQCPLWVRSAHAKGQRIQQSTF